MITELSTPAQPIDGSQLEALHEEWKEGIFDQFPGVRIRDSFTRNDTARTAKFISLAVLMPSGPLPAAFKLDGDATIVAVWVAESTNVGSREGANVSLTAKVFEPAVFARDLPEPFASLASLR